MVWEPTAPERAEKEADRLLPLMPGAGHIVHMPGHIYMRVGRYNDAVKANVQAVAADEDYIAQCHAQGLYALGYYPHNIHFIWFGASMSGQSNLAIASARKVAASIPKDAVQNVPQYKDSCSCRITRWCDSVAGMKCWPSPSPRTSRFTRSACRTTPRDGVCREGTVRRGGRELDALQTIVSDPALAKLPAAFSTRRTRSCGLRPRRSPRIAARRKDYDQALLHLERAVRLEDALVYTEPPDWHYPMRQSLGAVLLPAGRPSKPRPSTGTTCGATGRTAGRSLVIQALEAQGKKDAAAAIQKRFDKAWSAADVKLAASRF